MLHHGAHFLVSHTLSDRDSTSLSVEDMGGSFIRLRVENADMQESVLLTLEEAAWLRDVLVRRLPAASAAITHN